MEKRRGRREEDTVARGGARERGERTIERFRGIIFCLPGLLRARGAPPLRANSGLRSSQVEQCGMPRFYADLLPARRRFREIPGVSGKRADQREVLLISVRWVVWTCDRAFGGVM